LFFSAHDLRLKKLNISCNTFFFIGKETCRHLTGFVVAESEMSPSSAWFPEHSIVLCSSPRLRIFPVTGLHLTVCWLWQMCPVLERNLLQGATECEMSLTKFDVLGYFQFDISTSHDHCGS
jgi:hypothetical protein